MKIEEAMKGVKSCAECPFLVDYMDWEGRITYCALSVEKGKAGCWYGAPDYSSCQWKAHE